MAPACAGIPLIGPYSAAAFFAGAAFLAGAFFAGAAAAINCLVERTIDARMARTRARPLPLGLISPAETLGLACLTGGAGLWLLNPLFRILAKAGAREVMTGAPLQYVGVFRNTDIIDVRETTAALGLTAVQLHGSEDQAYVDALRNALPAQVQIWKALSVSDKLPARDYQHVDKYVFDNGQGGSGQRFDWSLLGGQSLDNVLLAGGLGADNCVDAAKTGCAGLDFNSGVESQPGIKDARLLASVFQTLRAY